jgi:hypothetical protein
MEAFPFPQLNCQGEVDNVLDTPDSGIQLGHELVEFADNVL